MNKEIRQAFDELEALRDEYFKTDEFNGNIYRRTHSDKWSIGEVVYHCYLLLKLTRQASLVYLPLSRMVMKIGRFKTAEYNGEMENIYAGPTMKAPKILEPDMDKLYSKGELRLMLEEETEKLKRLAEKLSDDEAYTIRYPDPVPDYPNVVQSVKLLLIHEKHHYNVLMERERAHKK
ncbi:DinB family protein [Lacicoccus qingdaonensis]|uniref:DinB superfamily protein n=1 Tax=Lacicoccus qingdaonensis TaxID=576118 RepID=A0A1G9FMF1_9BACL|nr:DinB family protein [Salinicoccus qingdaonensis]SDK89561.1 DinB superfamily protein [Salinicoccus qingdaonensis]